MASIMCGQNLRVAGPRPDGRNGPQPQPTNRFFRMSSSGHAGSRLARFDRRVPSDRMNAGRIDFISSYCDRWCERCAFTERCSAFACQVAQGMCGDAAAAIELAVGRPQPEEGEAGEPVGGQWVDEFVNVQPSAEDIAEFDRNETARRVRLDGAPVAVMAKAFMLRSTAWLKQHRGGIVESADPVVREALDVVAWDTYFISAKLHRALDGHDRARHGEDECDDHPVQNDWNGSVKVALISLERSELAWRLIGDATGGSPASALGDAVGNLRAIVLAEFPQAMMFVRPGFDEPWL
jgi:hypothetical protein